MKKKLFMLFAAFFAVSFVAIGARADDAAVKFKFINGSDEGNVGQQGMIVGAVVEPGSTPPNPYPGGIRPPKHGPLPGQSVIVPFQIPIAGLSLDGTIPLIHVGAPILGGWVQLCPAKLIDGIDGAPYWDMWCGSASIPVGGGVVEVDMRHSSLR